MFSIPNRVYFPHLHTTANIVSIELTLINTSMNNIITYEEWYILDLEYNYALCSCVLHVFFT